MKESLKNNVYRNKLKYNFVDIQLILNFDLNNHTLLSPIKFMHEKIAIMRQGILTEYCEREWEKEARLQL